MRTVLSLFVIIAAAVACPLLKNLKKSDCTCDVPKICPSTWNILKFESQCSTMAFQGKWYVQIATPTYIDEQNPLKTGLFCNSYPSTKNELIFQDTTPCDKTDYNIEYEVIDQSFNVYTQCIETTKMLFSPAYGKDSKYAIFNVGTEKYYKSPLIETYPFIDENLIRHKISDSCQREYTVAVIGADKHWKEYMVLAVINRYKNLFCDNEYIIWVMTRDLIPKWSTYNKAFEDIQKSGLNPYHLISVDHSLDSLVTSLLPSVPSVPSIPSVPSGPSVPTVLPGDINNVVQQTSVSKSSTTKSISTDSTSSTSTTSTTTVETSTVVIEISSDFTSTYEIGQCDLFNIYNLQTLKNLDSKTIRQALSGKYYLTEATPCSYFDSPNSRVGILNTAFPACSMQLIFDDISMDTWDYNTPHMVMDRGYNMKTGEIQQTRSYISSLYNADHPYGSTVFSIYSEGYYPDTIEELIKLKLDGMICKQPSDIYKHQIIASIIGYKENEYLLLSIANQYKNTFYTTKTVPLVYCYTRDRIPSQSTMNSITQELLRSGFNPNYLIKIDQTNTIDGDFIFEKSYYESTVTTFSSTNNVVSTKSVSSTTVVGRSTPLVGLPEICPQNWDVVTFNDQYSTVAFQGTWNVQMATPTYMKGNNPLKTGLFCNTYPSTRNQLIFQDTTPCDKTDYNIEYEVIDQSYNLYTQCPESTKTLFSPAYGKDSKYAIFNVGTEKYYKNPLTETYPFIDDKLIRHKIEGSCQREYTIAVIGADKHWKEYMVMAIINRYKNFFCDNEYIIWVMTRDLIPKWSTYNKAFEDIQKSGLNPYHLISVDHSLDSLPSLPTAPSGPLGPSVPSVPTITTGDINNVVQQTSVSKSSTTKSISTDSTSSTSTTSTTTVETSTVVIEISSDFTSTYEIGQCDLYNGIQILKSLDTKAIRRALSGKYYLAEATPCSYFDIPNSRVGILNTAFPACSMQLIFDDISMDTWDYNTPHMMMDRGYNMKTGEIQETRSYISSLYPADHPYGSTVFSIYSEGYYPDTIEELMKLKLDGMICKPPSDIYKHQIIASIIGYNEDDYLLLCLANQYKNPFFTSEPVYQVYAYTRDRIPSQKTMNNINQELLRAGYNPNYLIKIDQSSEIDVEYVFETSYYESTTSCWSSSSSSYSSTSSSYSSSSLSSTISIGC
ncbi:uncharacterized protein LOC113555557 [Rhopalosiphum maidis]|uniref:uncharacterized protein LOC113555557 n=1 Tax=Rhopalosiphum maidis TaxID=43146 RepID=UPI000F00810C|nr:uncharacterized protein LOC113555557 [Rhopalosiphum maidis]